RLPGRAGWAVNFPILTAIVAVPVVGAVGALLTPRSRPEIARGIGLIVSMATATLAGVMLWNFATHTAGYQFVERHDWFPSLGVRYLMGVDGISLFMVVLTALLFPLSLLASASVQSRVKQYVAFMLLLEAGILGVFVSLDLI